MSASSSKRERLEARITPQQKELLQEAAALEGTSLSDFVVRAQRAAEKSIRDYAVITLSARDSQTFVEALVEPPAPNAALRAAAEHYWQAVVSD